MSRRPRLLLAFAGVMILAAGLLFWRQHSLRGSADEVFFYDPSSGRLFRAPRTAIPPIRGTDGPDLDAVRAVVISTSGNPQDKASRRIAYLERYSPELKHQMEVARATEGSPEISRAQAQSQRFVRRPEDDQWFPMTSEEGERIVSEWAAPGPAGVVPVVCLP